MKCDTTVVCLKCGRTDYTNFANCLRNGWPICHELTMRMDSTDANIEGDVQKLVCEATPSEKL